MTEKTAYFDIPKPEVNPGAPFSLVTSIYEQEIASRNGGLDLSDREKILKMKGEDLDHYNSFIPLYTNKEIFKFRKEFIEKIPESYREINNPSSLLLNDSKDLQNTLSEVYQTLYAHYVLGKFYNMKKMFPANCCGRSSRNIHYSLLSQGYVSTLFAPNDNKNHTTIMMPFKIESTNETGIIVADPTSDQLWGDKKVKKNARNTVFVTNMDLRKYETNWARGRNIWPNDFK